MKHLPSIIAAVAALVSCWIVWQVVADLRSREVPGVDYAAISEGLARSETLIVSKVSDLLKAQDVPAEIKADIAKLRAEIKAVGSVVARLSGGVGVSVPSTEKTPHRAALTIRNDDGLRVAEIGYSPSDDAWDYRLTAHTLNFRSVLSEQRSGAFVFHHHVTVSDGEVSAPVVISRSEWTQVLPPLESKWWWSVHLDIGGHVAYAVPMDWTAGLELGITGIGYGASRNDHRFRLARVGLGIDSTAPGISLAPVAYNLGAHVPLISDLYTGAMVGYYGRWIVGVGIWSTI